MTLPVYEGPLDLLLHLIETQEMDISVVSLMTVTDQYLRTLNQLEEIEPGALADFLVDRLAPALHQVLSPAAQATAARRRRGGGERRRAGAPVARVSPLQGGGLGSCGCARKRGCASTCARRHAPNVEKRLDLSNVDLEKLQRALRKVLQRMPVDPPMPRVKTYTITVAEQIENVRSYLYAALDAGNRTRRGVSFEALLSRSATRIEVIVTFLAVLELVKLREIEVVQDDTFGEIELVLVGVGEAGAAQDDAQETVPDSAED